MKRKSLALFLLIPFLAGCSKTSELYAGHAYNSSNFMENFYTETNGVRDLQINKIKSHDDLQKNVNFFSEDSLDHIRDYDKQGSHPWEELDDLKLDNEYGRNNNLSKIDGAFAYGYLSKLYDGRVRCEGKFQLSRVQLDKHGYAAFFPKQLIDYSYFGLSMRGGTDYANTKSNPSPLKNGAIIDLYVNFYKTTSSPSVYDVERFVFRDVNIPCDNNGNTNLFSFYLTNENKYGDESYPTHKYNLVGTVAMSLEFELKSTVADLTDDAQEEKDHHFSVMLYEVMFPNSIWK